jgi:lipopolysaccharide export system protein LptA
MNHFSFFLWVGFLCFFGKDHGLRAEAVPIEIQAQKQIICNQKENFCTAEGDAVATRANLMVRAKILRIFFSSPSAAAPVAGSGSLGGDTKRTPIRLEAEGDVVITLGQRKAIGQKAVYDLVQGIFNLSGSPRLKTPQAEIRSEEPLVYFEKEDRAEVREGIFIETVKKYLLKARKTVIFFRKTSASEERKSLETSSSKEVERVESEEDVLLSTPRETLRADVASYDGRGEEVILRGNVKATQGNNLLEGAYGIVPLKDGEIKLYASDPSCPASKKRVKALLIPKDLQNKGGSDKKQSLSSKL